MHTFVGKKTRIHYNSDMSGDCIIMNEETKESVKVSCEDILDFVADYVRFQKIYKLEQKLEQMKTKDILGL